MSKKKKESITKDDSIEESPKAENNLPATTEEKSLAQYFADRSQKPSSRIYANLATDPFIAELANRRKLNYREMLLVVGTVVGSLDNEIQQLEAKAKVWNQMSNVINAPLIAPKKVDDEKKSSDNSGDGYSRDEVKWILKYLTLRNVLAVLFILISSAAAFFAWWNKDYQSLLQTRSERITALEAEVQKYQASNAALNAQTDKQNLELGELSGRLDAAEQRKKDLEEALRKAEQGQNRELNKQTASLRETVNQLKTSNAESKQWKDIYENTKETIQAKNSEISNFERRVSDLESRLNNSIDAWNQLLTYLNSRAAGGKLDLRTKDIKKQLEDLERYTKKVEGMKYKL